jgi:peroxiredoxin
MVVAAAVVSCGVVGCARDEGAGGARGAGGVGKMAAVSVASRAEDVRPVAAGQRAPLAAVRDLDGKSVDIGSVLTKQNTVLIFYRGGWCPYCNTHLAELAAVESQLRELGFQIVAVSPDRPEQLKPTTDKNKLGYAVYSDSDVALARAFGLTFRVDEPTRSQYKGYGIDLEAASGRNHYELPVPAVYLIDRSGLIRFAQWDPNYRKRLSGDEVLAAARQVNGSAAKR